MANDKYRLKGKSDADLHEWLLQQDSGTEAYHAAEEESMRRVAIIEAQMEKAEEPSRRRELIAISFAMMSIFIAIIFVVFSY